jgi:hypothetical protein
MITKNSTTNAIPLLNIGRAGICFVLAVNLSLMGEAKGQLPNVRETISENNQRNTLKETIESGRVSEKTGESLDKAKMYSQLLTFKYAPSERDPFISSEVISPFVTEEEVVEVTADAEQIKQAKRIIESVVRDRVELSGIAVGKTGASYTIAYTDPDKMIPQILRPGEYLLIELGTEDQSKVDGAYKLALQAGAKLKLKVAEDRPALMLRLLKIDGKSAEIENPSGDGSFSVEYQKRMIRTREPMPKSVDN